MHRLAQIVNFNNYLLSLKAYNKICKWYKSPDKCPNNVWSKQLFRSAKHCEACGRKRLVRYCDPLVAKDFQGSLICLECYLGDFLDKYLGKNFYGRYDQT